MTVVTALLTLLGAFQQPSPVSFLTLWETPSPAGREGRFMDLAERTLPPGLAARRDAYGSLIVTRKDARVKRVLAVGVDRATYVVSRIRPDGYLRLRLVGTEVRRHRYAEGRPVRIHARGGQVPGVVVVNSVHLRGARPERVGEEHLYVDIGADSAEQVRRLGVRLLDPVDARELVAMDGSVAGPGVAHRVIVATVLSLIRNAQAAGFPDDLAVAFVAQTRGARRATGSGWEGVMRELGADEAIVLGAGYRQENEAVRVREGSTGTPSTTSVYLRARHFRTPVELVSHSDVEVFSQEVARRCFGAEMKASITWPPVRVHNMPNPMGGAGHEDAIHYLAGLTAVAGVSGHEQGVRDTLTFFLNRILEGRARLETDAAGNMTLVLGKGERTLAFVAHLDEVGYVVQEIEEDGRLLMRPRGGLYPHLYGHSAMELVTPTGVLPCISVLEGGVMRLDVGASSKAEAEAKGIAKGQPATVPKEFIRLGTHRATGRSFDDRVGCAALVMAIARLDLDKLDRRVVFAWVTREETGLEGADALAKRLRPVPEVVFPVDTFVSSDNPRDDPRFAYAPLGRGAVLRAIDNTSITPRTVLDRVHRIARERKLQPLQVGIVAGGNDGSRFLRHGARVCGLSWPQRCSHSRVETMDLRDLEHLAALIAELARWY